MQERSTIRRIRILFISSKNDVSVVKMLYDLSLPFLTWRHIAREQVQNTIYSVLSFIWSMN